MITTQSDSGLSSAEVNQTIKLLKNPGGIGDPDFCKQMQNLPQISNRPSNQANQT